jgi:hypothetical protein
MDLEGKYARIVLQENDLYDSLGIWVELGKTDRCEITGRIKDGDALGLWLHPESQRNKDGEDVELWSGFKTEPRVSVLFQWQKIISFHLYDAEPREKPPIGIRPGD